MTVSTLIKRLAEFTESESGSTEVVICDPYDSLDFITTDYSVLTADKVNNFGQVKFEIVIKKNK